MRKGWMMVIVMLLMVCSLSTVYAEAGQGWYEKSSYYYYEKTAGKNITGLTTINKKKYYFDSKGRQRTGWQYIKKKYYFFTIANGEQGSMVTSKTVDGMKLNSKGAAKVTKANKKKLKVLVKANKVMWAATKPAQSKYTKLKNCFTYGMKHFKYKADPKFKYTKTWDSDYAYKFLFGGYKGSCYYLSTTFAYLANACGYEDIIATARPGHGWVQIEGKITDMSFGRRNGLIYFQFDLSENGKDGRKEINYQGKYFRKV